MNILIIHNEYQQPGGEDQVFREEAELLASHGHNVEKVLFDNKSISSTMKKATAGIGLLYNLSSAETIRAKVRYAHPDVIHVHNFFPLISPAVFYVARHFNIPVVWTLHNYRLVCPSGTLYHNGAVFESSLHTVFPLRAIVEGVYRHSVTETLALASMTAFHHLLGTWKDKVSVYIALTNFAKQKVQSSMLGIPPSKIVVKPNGVADIGQGPEGREDFFLFAGRLTEEKGIATMIDAVRDSSVKLKILGDGPLRSVVQDAAAKSANISYLGFRNRKDVRDFLKRCKALIVPSLWYEGLPTIIIEAFSAGTPVIASNLGSLPEVVTNGYDGLLFQPGNADELRGLLRNIGLFDLRQMAVNARGTYLRKYTPEINYVRLLDIYQSAIGGRTSVGDVRETIAPEKIRQR